MSLASSRDVDVPCSAKSKSGTDEGIVNSFVLDKLSFTSVWEVVVIGLDVDGEDAVTPHVPSDNSTHNLGCGDSGISLITLPPLAYLAHPPVG